MDRHVFVTKCELNIKILVSNMIWFDNESRTNNDHLMAVVYIFHCPCKLTAYGIQSSVYSKQQTVQVDYKTIQTIQSHSNLFENS